VTQPAKPHVLLLRAARLRLAMAEVWRVMGLPGLVQRERLAAKIALAASRKAIRAEIAKREGGEADD
jgi:hypothetical protein